MLKKLAKLILKEELKQIQTLKNRVNFLEKLNLDSNDNFSKLEANFDSLYTELTLFKDSILTIEVEKEIHKNILVEFGENEIKEQLISEAYDSLLNDIKPYIKLEVNEEFNFQKVNLKLDIFNHG